MRFFAVHSRRSRFAALLGIAWTLVFFFTRPEAGVADEVSGYLDFIYSHADSETNAATGTATKTESEVFRQQYGLTLTKRIYPALNLMAGGIFERNWSVTESGVSEMTSTLVRYRPFVDLTLHSPFVTAGAGYNRLQTTSESSVGPASTTIMEGYTGMFAWHREFLPSVSVRWEKRNAFDRKRSILDTVSDSTSFTSRYEPVTGLALRYDQSVSDTQDKLRDSEVQTHTKNGRADYGTSLFKNRVALYGSYTAATSETELIKSITGEVTVQLFAFAGLFAVDDTPSQGALNPASLLINGDTATSAGITIGLPVTVPGARNIGLDFGTATAVDSLAIRVIWNNASLPVEIANSFRWDVYTSADSQNWGSPVVVQASAVFDPFQNRFELQVPPVTPVNPPARYFKVVVRPLTPEQALLSPVFSTAADQQIHITELQAFRRFVPGGPVVSRSQSSNVGFRTTLMDTPFLTYDFDYSSRTSEGITESRSTSVSNGLSASHRFSEVFSGNARTARMDSSDKLGDSVAYIYSAGLNATPRAPLRHGLSYSRRTEKRQQEESTTDSLFIDNSASLYRGVDVNLGGGVTQGRVSTGIRTSSTVILSGATISPRPDLTFNSNYATTSTKRSGGGTPDTFSATRNSDLTVSYSPFRTLYLTASQSRVSQTGQPTDRSQSYNASWSPFPGGQLQVSVYYSESRRALDDSINRTFAQSLRWNVTNRMYIAASLVNTRSTSVLQESQSTSFTTQLRYSF